MKKFVSFLMAVSVIFLWGNAFAQEGEQAQTEETLTGGAEEQDTGPGFFDKIGNWMDKTAKESVLPYNMLVGLGTEFCSYDDVKDGTVGYKVFARKSMKPNWFFTAEPHIAIGSTSLPINTYSPTSGSTNYSGVGCKNYLTVEFGLFFHLNLIWKYLSVGGGIAYNSFQNGYIVESSNSTMHFVELEKDDFSYFAGASIIVPAFEKFYLGIYGGINKFMNGDRQGTVFGLSLTYAVGKSEKEEQTAETGK